MLNKTQNLTAIALLFSCFLWSCASGPSVEESAEVEDDTTDMEQVTEGEKIVYYGTPSLVEVASLMKSSGAQFNGDMMSELDNAPQYVENHLKALNLGVYGADLTYSAMFDHTQTAINYLKVIKEMAEELGLTSAFEEDLLKNIESNISNRDSLLDVITDFYWSADAYLVDNDRAEVAALIITGGWVESMFLACHMHNTNMDNQELMERIVEQQLILKNLVLFLQNTGGDDAHMVDLREKLRDLSEHYKSLTIKQVPGENTTDEKNGMTVIGSENEIVVAPHLLAGLCIKIEDLRMFIVNH